MLELVYPLYVTIGESLNISLGNNAAFLEGHFVRVEPLEVIIKSAGLPLLSVCNLWCLTPLFFCQLFLSRLIHSSRGTKFGIFREHVDYLHFVLLRRGRPRLFD